MDKLMNVEEWKKKWSECKPSMIYLILGVASILSSILFGEVGVLELLISVFVVAVMYYFLAYLCVEAPVVAWILIVLQLFILAVSIFGGSSKLTEKTKAYKIYVVN